MLPVDCPQCFRKTFYSELAICDYCGIVDHNFNPKEPQDQWQFGTESAATNYFFPEDRQMDEVVRTINGKGYEANDRMTADNSGDHEKCSSEIGVLGCILPTDTEHCEIHNDLSQQIRKTIEIEVNQVFQEDSNLKKTTQQSSASNLGNFQSTGNENASRKISNFEASERSNIFAIDNRLSVPGPSGLQDNKITSKLSGEEFPSVTSKELQPAVETHKTTLFCQICRLELDRHFFEDEGKFLYKCCQCQDVFSTTFDLQKHTNMHYPRLLPCNICGELIFDKDAHDKEETCNVCLEKFKCRTQLAQHTLIHKDYYASHCRVCGKNINDLIDPVTNFYNCCHCDFSNPLKASLQNHLYIHTGLKVFKCDVCGRRFTQYSVLSNHSLAHFKCKTCGKSFRNKKKARHTFEERPYTALIG